MIGIDFIDSQTPSSRTRRWDRNRFDRTFKTAMVDAQANAALFNHPHIDSHHIVLALVAQTGSAAWATMHACGIEYKHLYSRLALLDPMRPVRVLNSKRTLTPEATKAIYLAVEEAHSLQRKIIDATHLFLGILRVNNGLSRRVLESFGMNSLAIYRCIRADVFKKSKQARQPAHTTMWAIP